MSRTRPARAVNLALALALVATAFGPRPDVAAAVDRWPDLTMANLSSFRTEHAGAERRLRFTTNMVNEGAGPLEVRGSRASRNEPHLRTQQVVYSTEGGERGVASRALMEYAKDGHDHWHIQGVMLYQMWSDDGQVRRGTKVGFCFLDSRWMFGGTPSAYSEAMCGDNGDLSNRMGLSVGWGDEYPANFAFQWIDITTLADGDYTVQARADEQNWYVESNEGNNCAWARVRITSTDGAVQVLSQGRTCLAPPASTARVERQYGMNRYETTAAVSEDAFAPGVPVAYVATGRNFPDALAAGAAAGAQRGPLILVEPNFIPALALTELERLDPQRIIVVGGSAVVSDYVVSLLAPFAGSIWRIAGGDRYATAALVSSVTHAPGVSTAYVTTGQNWPDALAAVPHAVRASGPLLLTTRDTLPASVAAELDRVNPGRIIILGGSGVVSDGVAAALDAYDTGGGVYRVAGADRFQTAALASSFHHPGGAPIAYVASGSNFPDALAAGPAVGVRGGPTLLVMSTFIPGPTSDELARLNMARIIVLGGPSVISQAVQNALAPYTAS